MVTFVLTVFKILRGFVFRWPVDVAFYSYEKLVEGGTLSQPMIILHGLMGSRQNWQSLAKVFGKDGRRVSTSDKINLCHRISMFILCQSLILP